MQTVADERLARADELLQQCQEELYSIVIGRCQGIERYLPGYMQEIGDVFCTLIELRRKLDPEAPPNA